MSLKSIVVFCGSSIGFNETYKNVAIQLGEYFAANEITLVYGGGKIGMMGAISNTIIANKGKVVGIIPNLLKHEEVLNAKATNIIVTDTMSERKVKMSRMADAYMALPGGFGTLDELFEVLTLQQLHIEQKPVGILNINGFFDYTIKQLDVMVKEGFLKPENRAMLVIDATIDGLMKKMNAYKAPEKTAVINKVVR